MSGSLHLPVPVALASSVSTNDDAFAYLEQQSTCVIWTLDQTGGRGSRGRSWLAPKECGLALSIGVQGKPYPHPARFCYPLFAGLLLYEGLAALLGPDRKKIALKWPNDLLMNGRKLAGILCESKWTGGRPRIVLGMGVNLRAHRAMSILDKGFASLEELRDPPGPERIVAEITARFPEILSASLDRDELHARWLARCRTRLGTHLAVRAHGRRLQGRFQGLSEEGALLLADANGQLHGVEQSCDDFVILDTDTAHGGQRDMS